jgi:hypothetical protein
VEATFRCLSMSSLETAAIRAVFFFALFGAGACTLGAGASGAEPIAKSPPATTGIPSRAVSAKVWNLEPTANGFQWVAPGGGAVLCKFAGVSGVDNTQLIRAGQDTNVVPDKYATWPMWAQAQNSRLKSRGFNAAGMYSEAYMNPPN